MEAGTSSSTKEEQAAQGERERERPPGTESEKQGEMTHREKPRIKDLETQKRRGRGGGWRTVETDETDRPKEQARVKSPFGVPSPLTICLKPSARHLPRMFGGSSSSAAGQPLRCPVLGSLTPSPSPQEAHLHFCPPETQDRHPLRLPPSLSSLFGNVLFRSDPHGVGVVSFAFFLLWL